MKEPEKAKPTEKELKKAVADKNKNKDKTVNK